MAIYVLAHLATVTTSRLPWFDDTFFSSVADSLVRTGELKLRVSPLWLDKPVYLYGPVYFWVLGGVYEFFGLGIPQTRLPGLLFGFGILALAFAILRRAGVGAGLAGMTCLLLGLDPTFHQSIHSGRMDSMALFLILASFHLVQRAGATSGRAGLAWALGSGVLAATAALTTPRPGYLLAPIGLILVGRWARKPDREHLLQVTVWGMICLVLLAGWVAYAFGSIPGLLAYYAEFSEAYTSGGLGVRAIHAPVLLPLIVLLAVALAVRPRILLHELIFFTVAGTLGFYVFVKDKGAFSGLYSFFMIPLAYLAIGYLLGQVRAVLGRDTPAARWLGYGVVGGLLAFNGAVFAARSTLEVVQWRSRSPAVADAAIAQWIPAGARVVGDEKFYYAVRRAGSDFQYFQRGGTPVERARHHRDDYGLQYLVTADHDTSELLRTYQEEIPLAEVAAILAPPEGTLARFLTNLARAAGIGTSLTASYEGRIYARVGGPPATAPSAR